MNGFLVGFVMDMVSENKVSFSVLGEVCNTDGLGIRAELRVELNVRLLTPYPRDELRERVG